MRIRVLALSGLVIVALAPTGETLAVLTAITGFIGGVPDVLFFNTARHRLYTAIGDPGVIDVFDIGDLELIQTVATEKGAHNDCVRPRAKTKSTPSCRRPTAFLDKD